MRVLRWAWQGLSIVSNIQTALQIAGWLSGLLIGFGALIGAFIGPLVVAASGRMIAGFGEMLLVAATSGAVTGLVFGLVLYSGAVVRLSLRDKQSPAKVVKLAVEGAIRPSGSLGLQVIPGADPRYSFVATPPLPLLRQEREAIRGLIAQSLSEGRALLHRPVTTDLEMEQWERDVQEWSTLTHRELTNRVSSADAATFAMNISLLHGWGRSTKSTTECVA